MSGTTRVALMELRTAVYRAYIAAGASSGEAEAAAEAATRAEVLVGGGMCLAEAGLGRVPGRVGARVVEGAPDRIDDPASRAPLLAARLALDWLAATGRPVVVPGLVWDDALVGALPAGVCAIGSECGAAALADGVALFDGTGGLDVEVPDGVLFVRAIPGRVRREIDGESVRRRWREAGAQGLDVPADAWAALDAAAARYLVPEAV